ncbi:MAG: corrinoid protein [Candidatus Methanomethyliaceae archaeon]|nr:corrinoid protein [Candidatus Methanomethyliaceae archaeon]
MKNMQKEELIDKIKEAIINIQNELALEYTKEAINAGVNPQEIISNSIVRGLEIIGEKFEKGEYFLSELIAAGEISKQIISILSPILRASGASEKKLGRVVIGTVRGDIHDIGKNIVAMLLDIAGFEVIDLGADVPPEKFVDAILTHNPDIVAMSALLTVTMPEMKCVIEELKKENLRERVKVIIGGAPVTREYAEEIGADGYGENAFEGVTICKSWIKSRV